MLKKYNLLVMFSPQGTQTEGGDLAQAVCSEEAKEEKDENMYTFHLFQFKEVCHHEKVSCTVCYFGFVPGWSD